ncbi:MAG TPA: DUF4127 family protein [Thermotogota bacterium]|nr:DUF4127 family protein [Thermotogota bacterium]
MNKEKLRIVYLPVDERFCTRDYFLLLAQAAGLEVVTPPREMLGQKKIRADVDGLHRWLESNVHGSELCVLSMEMLLHGGLIPSRINLCSEQTLLHRLQVLRSIRPRVKKLFLASTVTRIPKYDSDDEEPVYWEYFGKRIQEHSLQLARQLVGSTVTAMEKSYASPPQIPEIPSWMLHDFYTRRKRNFHLVEHVLELVKEGCVDFLNLTLDDNGEGSLSVVEAGLHAQNAEQLGISGKVSIHPGADEAPLALLSRVLCEELGQTPLFEVSFTSPQYAHLVPPYEGSPLDQSVTQHVECSGARVAKPGEANEQQQAIRLVVHNRLPGDWGESSDQQMNSLMPGMYDVFDALAEGQVTGIADLRFPNGSDDRVIDRLLAKRRDWTRVNVSGWNTPGNSLGTVVSHSIVQWLGVQKLLPVQREKMEQFAATLILEHWGYQAHVRQRLRKEAPAHGCTLWTLLPDEQWALCFVRTQMQHYLQKIEQAFQSQWEAEYFFPWHRSFELGIVLHE